MKSDPVGIFDSGIGGLTVTKEILTLLPNENIIYLGDTARVPYGTRDKEVITTFALELVNFLLKRNVKLLVVACNTISAICLDKIKQISPVPVLAVISPTVKAAIPVTKTKKIGVIGTRATIHSDVYKREIKALDNTIEIFEKSCPLFVPLAEEGFTYHPATKLIAEEYLRGLKHQIDTLVLGCTHYPLLRQQIQEVMGEGVTLIDSAHPTARALKEILEENDLLNDTKKIEYRFFVTDAPERVFTLANLFFDNEFPGRLEKVEL